MKRKILIISIISLLLDQIVKYIVHINKVNIIIIKNLCSITYTQNNGVAFSMLSGSRIPIIILSIVLIIILLIILKKEYLSNNKDFLILDVGYGILLGGIFGNLIDRVFRKVVIDYISLKIFGYYFPVFNIADLLITVGIIIIIFKNPKDDKLKNKNS